MTKTSATDTHKRLDFEEILINITVTGNNDSLPSQFLNTLTMAEIAIKRAEAKHPTLITKGWKNLEFITTDNKLDRRAINLPSYQIMKDALLPTLYFNLLCEIRILRDMTTRATHQKKEPEIPFDFKEILKYRLSSFAGSDIAMLNAITPCIFSIFMFATRLIGNIDNRTAATNNNTVATRTQNGGLASNHGEEVLINYFSDIIRNFPKDEKWKSLSKMFDDKSEILNDNLITFQSKRFYSNENKPVTAGSKLKPDGLYNAFRNWAKKDVEFLAALKERVPSFRT